MNLTIDHFEDAHIHASSLNDWNQTYSQLTPGRLQSSLLQVCGRRFHVLREYMNQRIVQHGEAPRDRVCIAVPLAVPGVAHFQGREVDARSIFVLKDGDEFMFHTPVGIDMLAITFDRTRFEQAIADAPRPGEFKALFRQPVIQVSPDRLAQSCVRLQALVGQVFDDPSLVDTAEAELEFEEDLLEEILFLVADPGCDKGQRHGSSSGSFIVEKCHHLTFTDAQDPPSVLELCQRLRVSRRAVQRGFRSVAQTNPVNYMRCLRLNGVRRELINSHASELTIGDAAGRWGFFHLSHFAADYQALFGELPSQTRRCASKTSLRAQESATAG